MDGFNEKKWFVYLSDHHEGPFSLAEIEAKMTAGQVTSTHFVWAEGMPDWKVMSEVEAFEALVKPNVPSSPPVVSATVSGPAISSGPAATTEPQAILSPKVELEGPAEAAPQPEAAQGELPAKVTLVGGRGIQAEAEAAGPAGTSGVDPAVIAAQKRRSRKLIKYAVLLVIIGGIGFAYQAGYLNTLGEMPVVKAGRQQVLDLLRPLSMKFGSKVPILTKWISPIPALSDVAPDDYEQLRAAASADLKKDGPMVSIALSRSDLSTPAFYIASNLPDGTNFDVFLEGIPDTLLNQMSYFGKSKATIDKRLATSTRFKFQDTKPLPKGEYNVYVVARADQPAEVKAILDSASNVTMPLPKEAVQPAKLAGVKAYFLSGEKDQYYLSHLKMYHDELKKKAEDERKELGQFAVTLESQLSLTQTSFAKLRGNKGKLTPSQQKKWAEFHNKWLPFTTDLNQKFQKWTDSIQKNEFFYVTLYQLTQQAGQALFKVHEIQNSYFVGYVDAGSFDSLLTTAASEASSAVVALKEKLEKVEKLPLTSSGMPQKEGL